MPRTSHYAPEADAVVQEELLRGMDPEANFTPEFRAWFEARVTKVTATSGREPARMGP